MMGLMVRLCCNDLGLTDNCSYQRTMKTDKTIRIVGCHAEGEVGDVVVSGVEPPPGDSVWEQSRYIAEDGRLKDFLLNEPRGGVFRHVNLLVPPVNPAADMGCIIMEPETVPPMSGSNTICVTTVLLETGILPMSEPETRLTLEMPGGLVEVTAQCRQGRVMAVTLTNLPSFVATADTEIVLDDGRSVTCTVVFGGDSFVIVDAEQLGVRLEAAEAHVLTRMGMQIATTAQQQIGFRHPTLEGMNEITFCLFAGPVTGSAEGLTSTHAVAIKPGKLDRSPTGTGASARLALMHARGEIGIGDEIIFRSVIGSEFRASIQAITQIEGCPAVIPTVTGRAWITGRTELILDETDPWPTGYRLSDTWPRMNTP